MSKTTGGMRVPMMDPNPYMVCFYEDKNAAKNSYYYIKKHYEPNFWCRFLTGEDAHLACHALNYYHQNYKGGEDE